VGIDARNRQNWTRDRSAVKGALLDRPIPTWLTSRLDPFP
jgi:hypothetical protein